MTVIAAGIIGNQRIIGADSCVSGLGTKDSGANKLLSVGPAKRPYGILGIAGAASILLEAKRTPAPKNRSEDAWMSYLDSLSLRLQEVEGGKYSLYLALSPHGIHKVTASGPFSTTPEKGVALAAIGSGGAVALGTMRTLVSAGDRDLNSVITQGLTQAINIAEGCAGPLRVIPLKG